MSPELGNANACAGPERIPYPPGAGLGAAEEEAEQRSARASQRITALGEMARGIAHDFRNVLAIIQSGLRLAEANIETPATARHYIDAARDGIERGSRLAAQLLAFAKPGKLDIHAEDANALIGKLALFLKYGAGPGIRVRFDLADTIPVCLIDPAQFNAAILNLVVNARDAMPEGGEIRIASRSYRAEAACEGEPNEWLLIRVADTGHGMSGETLQRIFDPYFTTKGNSGTGLGVPQVQAFMRSIGGQVRVTSEAGVGTCFDLLFPAMSNTDPGPNTLWRQIDRWTNEGGAPEPADPLPAPTDDARRFGGHAAAGDLQ